MINTAGFANPIYGTFNVSEVGESLVLNYKAPEPLVADPRRAWQRCVAPLPLAARLSSIVWPLAKDASGAPRALLREVRHKRTFPSAINARVGVGYTRLLRNGSLFTVNGGYLATVFINSFAGYETNENIIGLQLGALSTAACGRR